VDVLGDAPDVHVLPVGNAGNITASWKGYNEYRERGGAKRVPQMGGCQAAGAAPPVLGHPVDDPDTLATAIRSGNPASWSQAEAARDGSGGFIVSVTDDEILLAHRFLSREEGIFVEPGSAASVAGLLKTADAGRVPDSATIAVTVTGHGLKDPSWALHTADGSEIETQRVSVDAVSAARALGLEDS